MRENIKKLVLSLLFVLCIFTSMPVLAEIVTFDNLPGSGEKQIPAGYSGFNWNNGWYLNATDNIYQNSGYQTALTSGSNVAFGANYDDVQISAANGADFTFNSAYFAAAWNNGLSLNLQGYNNGSLKYDMTYSLNTTEKK